MLEVPKGFIKELDKVIYKFIWGKKDKIRRRTIICPLNEGGLNMIDIESQFMSLKSAWLHRLLGSTKTWNLIGQYYLSNIAPNYEFLEMSFTEVSHMPCVQMLPGFYQEVLLGISKLKCLEKIASKNILYNQFIWGNLYIQCENKCLYNRHWIVKGFIYLHNILQPNGLLKDNIFNTLKDKREYCKVLSMLNKGLRQYRIMRYNQLLIEPYTPCIFTFEIMLNKSKYYYSKFVFQKKLLPRAISVWKNTFPDFECSRFYKNKLKYQRITKIQEFNFKMFHNILSCGETLYKWEIKAGNLCQ